MNYEDMSDWEVTKRVVEIRCAGQFIKYQPQRDAFEPIESGVMDDALYITTESGREQEIDCCNNPSDAWSIIVENKIGITHGSQMCSAVTVTDNELIQVTCFPSKILRAAMICFLKMKDAEK